MWPNLRVESLYPPSIQMDPALCPLRKDNSLHSDADWCNATRSECFLAKNVAWCTLVDVAFKSCEIQSMTLYVWEKSGYFTRSLGQSVRHCSPHLKVLCHTRHAKSYTPKLDDPSLSKVFSCMTKVVFVSKCLQILAMPKVHLMSQMSKIQSAILTS